jgi:broad specificity phosphatase PhoE
MIILIRHAQSEGNSKYFLSYNIYLPLYCLYVVQYLRPTRISTRVQANTNPENRDIHQTIPDHRVKLTSEGWTQALDAGRRLRSLLRADDTLHFFTSPYRRTRETTEGILSTLTADEPSPSPFPRHSIKVYEEPRLREQDFGNFQPCSAEMERMWQERADYGHFFYRIPNGESAADAYDRVSGFNESLWRQFGEDDCASVCVLGMSP